MNEIQGMNLPTCAACFQPFLWDEAYQHRDTPGSAPYNPPRHGSFRPRAYCPNCGALVAEWHIDQLKDYHEWAWYGNNAILNANKPLPPSPRGRWGRSIPVQILPKFDEHRLSLALAPAAQICKRCGRSIKASHFTCPYCGYTPWETIVVTMVILLLCLGAAIFGGSHIAAPWLRSVVVWGGGILVGIALLETTIRVIKEVRIPRKRPPESAVGGVTAPAPGTAMGAVRSRACAKCGLQRDGQDVRIYYGNKKAKSSQSYSTEKSTTVITTTSYNVGGWDDVSICDHCTKKRSRVSGLANLVWSVPLALFGVVAMVKIGNWMFSEGLQGSNPVLAIFLLLAIVSIGTEKVVVSVQRLVKPLNETSRSAVARKVVRSRQAGRFDTFWTPAEFAKLRLS